MPRQPRASTVAGALAAMESATSEPLPPPWPLPASCRSIWTEIVARRARGEWREVDLHFAFALAGVLAQLHDEQQRLSGEGSVIDGKANPRCAIVGDLERRAVSLSKFLRIHPGSDYRSTPSTVRGKREAEKAARAAIGAIGSGFLARN